MRGYTRVVAPLVGLIGISLFSVGCGRSSYQIKVSAESKDVLETIASQLRTVNSEVDFHCVSPSGRRAPANCAVTIGWRPRSTLSDVIINRPQDDGEGVRPLALRIHGGSQEFQRSLYHALGKFTETCDYMGQLDSREFRIEGGNIRFRCTATRSTSRIYECWVIVGARLFAA